MILIKLTDYEDIAADDHLSLTLARSWLGWLMTLFTIGPGFTVHALEADTLRQTERGRNEDAETSLLTVSWLT